MTSKPLIKVLHIASERTWRGGENQIRLLMEGMAELGYEPHLAADPTSEIFRRLNDKFPVCVVPMRRISWPVTVYQLHRYCKRQGIRIIDAHSSKAHDLGLGLVSLDRRRKLVVHRRVDYPVARQIDSGGQTPYKYRSAKVSRYVAISEAISRVLQESGIAASRITVVRSAVDGTAHQNVDRLVARQNIRQLLGIRPETIVFGNASALSVQKGYGYLMQACADLKSSGADFHCVIAGDGPLRDQLERQRIELNLDNHLSFLGFIKEIPEFLAALDFIALPSIDEGLGTVALDAALAGCPIIAANVGGLPEIVAHETTGLLVPPRDPQALAQAMLRLMRDFELRAKLASAAKQHVEAEFSVAKMISGNLAVYEQLRSSINPVEA